MRSQDITEIRSLRLFADCRADTFEALMRNGFLQRFPPGVVLIQENDPADFLYVVVEGMVEMYSATNGRETTIEFVRPIGTFILAAVLKDGVYLQSARTLEKSRILMISAENVRQAMHDDTKFMAAIVQEIATRYRDLVKDLKNQKLRSGTERLANWLLKTNAAESGNGVIELAIEKRLLASRLGMTPENLSRAFASLGAYNVEVDGRTIRLRDIHSLEAFAKPSPLIDSAST